jgi:hypothetical protein
VTTSRFRARIAFTELEDIASREGVGATYAGRLLRLASLAPDIVTAILEGRQLPELTGNALMPSSTTSRSPPRAIWSISSVPKPETAEPGEVLRPAGRVAGLAFLPRLEIGAPFRTFCQGAEPLARVIGVEVVQPAGFGTRSSDLPAGSRRTSSGPRNFRQRRATRSSGASCDSSASTQSA